MTELYLADALQEVSPELVMEAMLPLRKQSRKYRHFLAFAACFALVTVCSFTISQMSMGGAGSDTAAPESEGAVMEGIEDSEINHGGNGHFSDSHSDGSAAYDYVVYDTSHQELISFDLEEMYERADIVVIGQYSDDFTQYEESGVGVHLYSFTVEESVKGNVGERISIRLPVWRRIAGDIEGDRYSFVVSDATFFDPAESGQVMLFLQEIESGVYRKAQEPFTVAIAADGTTELRSNFLLPTETREELSSTITETESGRTLLYTDSTLLQYHGSAFSGLHINELLEFFGSDLRITD